MNSRLNLWSLAAAVLVIASLPAWWWGPMVVASVLTGGLWNLGSLWCLSRLLGVWVSVPPPVASAGGGSAHSASLHRRRQVGGWLAAKLAWIGVLIGGILRAPWLSFIGFGAGVTVVLLVVVAGLGIRAKRASPL